MITFAHVFITPHQADVPAAVVPATVHGPYRFLSQAEYVARILRRLDDDGAEIVPAGRNGLWWVRVRSRGA